MCACVVFYPRPLFYFRGDVDQKHGAIWQSASMTAWLKEQHNLTTAPKQLPKFKRLVALAKTKGNQWALSKVVNDLKCKKK
jgi:hypothetical protein